MPVAQNCKLYVYLNFLIKHNRKDFIFLSGCRGHVRGIATFMKNDETKVVVTSDVSDSPASKSPANKLTSFCLPADLLNSK